MTDVLSDRLQVSTGGPATRRTKLVCESQLRVAAAMLRRASVREICAVTTVGVLGADDVSAFRSLVAAIEREFELKASVRFDVESFSVRFIRART